MSDTLPAAVIAEVTVAAVIQDTPQPPPVAAFTAAPALPSIKESVVRNAWRDLRRFLTLFFAATTVLACYHVVRLEYGDVRDFYTYVGTVGPLTVVDDPAGNPSAGRPEAVFHPGERVGWVSNFCASPGHPYTAYVSLVQVGGPSGGVAVDSRVRRWSGDAHRCGPLFGYLTIPSDAASGAYHGRRYGVFREGAWWPLRFDFPDFTFTVTQKNEGVEALSTNRSTTNP